MVVAVVVVPQLVGNYGDSHEISFSYSCLIWLCVQQLLKAQMVHSFYSLNGILWLKHVENTHPIQSPVAVGHSIISPWFCARGVLSGWTSVAPPPPSGIWTRVNWLIAKIEKPLCRRYLLTGGVIALLNSQHTVSCPSDRWSPGHW